MSDKDEKKDKHEKHKIQIDRVKYEVPEDSLTGSQLRSLPEPDIGPERDLFEVVPGHPDRKIANDDVVEITNGRRFFTAPAHINPGKD